MAIETFTITDKDKKMLEEFARYCNIANSALIAGNFIEDRCVEEKKLQKGEGRSLVSDNVRIEKLEKEIASIRKNMDAEFTTAGESYRFLETRLKTESEQLKNLARQYTNLKERVDVDFKTSGESHRALSKKIDFLTGTLSSRISELESTKPTDISDKLKKAEGSIENEEKKIANDMAEREKAYFKSFFEAADQMIKSSDYIEQMRARHEKEAVDSEYIKRVKEQLRSMRQKAGSPVDLNEKANIIFVKFSPTKM